MATTHVVTAAFFYTTVVLRFHTVMHMYTSLSQNNKCILILININVNYMTL